MLQNQSVRNDEHQHDSQFAGLKQRFLCVWMPQSRDRTADDHQTAFAIAREGPHIAIDKIRNQEGINIVPIRPEEICKGDPRDVMGLEIHLIFFDDKLIKINYINTLSISTVLFDISNNDYKTNFKRNQQQVEKKQSEFYDTTINNNSYFYVLLKDKDVQQEYLEINSDKDSEKLDKFLLKTEETQ